jgi:hypothetical protein
VDDRNGDAGDGEAGSPAGPTSSDGTVDDAPAPPPVIGWDTGVQWETVDPAAGSPPEPPILHVGSVVRRSIDLFLQNVDVFVVLGLPGALVAAIGSVLYSAPPPDAWVFLLAVFFQVAVSLVLGLAMIIAADELRAGRALGFGPVVGRALGRAIVAFLSALAELLALFGLVVIGAILLSIVVLAGSGPLAVVVIGLLLIAPAIYVELRWSLATVAIALEPVGPIQALGRSRKVTKGSLWRITGVFVLLALMTAPLTIGISFLSFVTGGSWAAILLTLLAGLATVPIFTIASTTVFGDLTGRPEVAPTSAQAPLARSIFVTVIVAFGVLALAVSIPRIGPAFERLALTGVPLADRGRILTGTTPNPANPCRPLDVRTSFTTSDSIYIGGYFTRPVPAGQAATVQVYANGALVNSAQLASPAGAVACYYERNPIVGGSPGTYRLVISLNGETIAEGAFSIQ